MKAFYESADLRWRAIQDDLAANADGSKRLDDIKYSLSGDDGAPTNTAWEFTNLVLPQLVWQNPTLAVSSVVPGEPRYGAIGLKFALESLMNRQDWNVIWEQVFSDALAWRGVTMVSVENVSAPRYASGLSLIDWRTGTERKTEKGEKIDRPSLYYIHPEDFFSDCAVRTNSTARRMGHRWQDSVTRLRELAKTDKSYHAEAIESFAEARSNQDNDLVTVTQMIVFNHLDPEALDAYDGDEDPKNDGLHTGTIYTMIAGSGSGTDLRKPRLYRGPSCGPYQVYECVPLAGTKDRMAPLAAVWPQIDRDARVGEALIDACENFKSITIGTEGVINAIKSADSNGFASFGGAPEILEQGLRPLEHGGPPSQLIESYNFTRQSLDRTLGISDTQRGIASGDTTATAETLANKSTDVKIGMLRNSLHRASEKQIYVAAWHILHAANYYEVLPDDARSQGLEIARQSGLDIPQEAIDGDDDARTIYTGGDALTGDPLNAFDSFLVKIEPMSMERTSEGLQQRRTMGMVELLERILTMQMQFPALDGKGLAERIGAQMNMPGLGKFMPGKDAAMGPGAGPMGPGAQPTGVEGNQSGGDAAGAMR